MLKKSFPNGSDALPDILVLAKLARHLVDHVTHPAPVFQPARACHASAPTYRTGRTTEVTGGQLVAHGSSAGPGYPAGTTAGLDKPVDLSAVLID